MFYDRLKLELIVSTLTMKKIKSICTKHQLNGHLKPQKHVDISTWRMSSHCCSNSPFTNYLRTPAENH